MCVVAKLNHQLILKTGAYFFDSMFRSILNLLSAFVVCSMLLFTLFRAGFGMATTSLMIVETNCAENYNDKLS